MKHGAWKATMTRSGCKALMKDGQCETTTKVKQASWTLENKKGTFFHHLRTNCFFSDLVLLRILTWHFLTRKLLKMRPQILLQARHDDKSVECIKRFNKVAVFSLHGRQNFAKFCWSCAPPLPSTKNHLIQTKSRLYTPFSRGKRTFAKKLQYFCRNVDAPQTEWSLR